MNNEEHISLIIDIVRKQRRAGFSDSETEFKTRSIVKKLIDLADLDAEIAEKTMDIIFPPENPAPKKSVSKKASTTSKTSISHKTASKKPSYSSSSSGSCSSSSYSRSPC